MQRDTPKYVIDISKNLRKSQTDAESILWEGLRNRKLKGFKFRRQYPIGRYIADFYCDEARLVIELDGGIHSLKEVKEYDEIRSMEIEAREIRILRYSNQDVYDNLKKIIDEIAKALERP